MSRELEIKDFSFEVKATGENTFEGYASAFDNIDSHKDIIVKGAFAKTIRESKRVKVLWQHDPYQPIGKPEMMAEDSKGLHVKAKISNTQLGKDVVQLIKDGVIDELSIGFNTIKDEWDQKSGARIIKEVKLWEFSPVTFASNDQAGILGIKNNPLAPNLDKLQNWIDGELKAGKVLSAQSETLVQNAIDALTALLGASKKAAEPVPTTPKLTEDEQKAAEDIFNMLNEMKKFAQK